MHPSPTTFCSAPEFFDDQLIGDFDHDHCEDNHGDFDDQNLNCDLDADGRLDTCMSRPEHQVLL